MFKKEHLIFLIIIVIFATILLFIYKGENISNDYDFKVYFFNAGKADAILLSKDDKYMMIDTGESTLSDDILRYFESNNITRLEYLIITHFDKDHVGSASTIIDNIEIGEVLQSNSSKESEYYTNYINSLLEKSITPVTVSGDLELSFSDLKVTVNGPESLYDSSESNNSSLIVSIIDDENSFLFMGDSENARIKDFISNNTNTYDFLKVPYHGFYLKQLDNLLDNIDTKYGVITCSSSEGCEDDTLRLLEKYNINYYLTKNGTISIYSNGTDIKIKQ